MRHTYSALFSLTGTVNIVPAEILITSEGQQSCSLSGHFWSFFLSPSPIRAPAASVSDWWQLSVLLGLNEDTHVGCSTLLYMVWNLTTVPLLCWSLSLVLCDCDAICSACQTDDSLKNLQQFYAQIKVYYVCL